MAMAEGYAGTTEPEQPHTSVTVPLYIDSSGSEFLVGSFLINETGNKLAAMPVEDSAGSVIRPISSGPSRRAIYSLNTASAASVQIEETLSDDGVLLVKIPATFVQARGLKQAMLAGIRAARQELQASIEILRVIKIVPLK
jgi:hypothetical protein